MSESEDNEDADYFNPLPVISQMTDDVKNENQSPSTLETSQGRFVAHVDQECTKLSDNIFMFPERNIGQYDNIYEGEVRSSVYGVRPCVIKFAQISEQNIREAEILTKLGSHTNVIAIIQSGTYCDVFEEHVYIALDKCHDENLRQYLANRTAGIEFDLTQAIDFAKQIIVGVMYIHDNNVIHLDLKPSNILISQNLRVIKIADFGLSIIVKSPKSKVFHKGQFGTNGYRPVESFGNGEVSMRTDIFSLGAVLLHLLSNGNEVFGRDEHTFIHNVRNDDTDISGLLVGNHVTTGHLIKCMVSKERLRRPTIWEVSDHPCWLGKEVECNFEYFNDEEIDDNALDSKDSVTAVKKEIDSPSDIENERQFLAKMREIGFSRRLTIAVFDSKSQRLYRLDLASQSMDQMHEYDKYRYFEAVAIGEYIYVFNVPMSEFALYRLEYCDAYATWQRMTWPDWNEMKGFPRVVASEDAIYLVGGYKSNSVYMYNPSLDQWKKLPDKSVGTNPAVVCSNGFLYCIGGSDVSDELTTRVERLDLRTLKWKRLVDTNRRHGVAIAVECGQNIYVFSNHPSSLIIEMYNPKSDEWIDIEFTDEIIDVAIGVAARAVVFDGDIYLIDKGRVFKYDVKKNRLSNFARFANKRFENAVLVRMSD